MTSFLARFARVAPALVFVCRLGAGEDFPVVPDDLEVSLFAKEPIARNPCVITFDAKGRLCVGMGPQYRAPRPETPPDSVWIVTACWSHGRDYGALVLNPFPKQPKERREPYVTTTVKKGERFRLRYAVLVHEVDAAAFNLAELAKRMKAELSY